MKQYTPYISTIFQILLGGLFIFSAYVKLEPLEPFKFLLSEQLSIKSWWLVEILSRLIIGLEFFIGLGLISFVHSKKFILICIIFITTLSFYLIYTWITFGANADCGCFGDYLQLSVKESLIKNVLLITAAVFTYQHNILDFKVKHFKIYILLSLTTALAFPWIFNSPDKLYENPYKNEIGEYLNLKLLNRFNNGIPPDSLLNGKKIICFFSTTCKYCAYAAKKITLFQKNHHTNLPVFYVFWGDEETLKIFWEKTNAYHFPYQIAKTDVFFSLSGNQLPAIYFLENGIVKAKHGYRTLDDNDIKLFVEK